MKRLGQWAYSVPFSLNNFYNDVVQSIKFITHPITVDPLMIEFNPSGVSPSGSRHLTTHPSFVRILASGEGIASLQFEPMDLNSTNISKGSGISHTKCFIFRVRHLDTPNTRVHNMKVWVSDFSDFLTPNTAKVVFETSKDWVQNKTLPVSYILNKSKWMQTVEPTGQNLFRTNGNLSIAGSGDGDVSQYVYLALAASGTTPLGEYGNIHRASGFKIRVTFDVDNLYPFKDK